MSTIPPLRPSRSTCIFAVVGFIGIDEMRFTKNVATLQRKFFACRQLPFARIACETSEMIDVLASATNPITGLNVSAAFRALVAEVSEKTRGNETIVLRTCAFTCNSLAGKGSADLSRSTLIAYPALFDTRRIADRLRDRLSSRRVDRTDR